MMVLVAKLWRRCKEGGLKPDGLWNKRPGYIYWSEGEGLEQLRKHIEDK